MAEKEPKKIPELIPVPDSYLEGEPYKNTVNFLAHCVYPIHEYPEGVRPDYTNGKIYSPPVLRNQTIEEYNNCFEAVGERYGLGYSYGEVASSQRKTRHITRQGAEKMVKTAVSHLHKSSKIRLRISFPSKSLR